MAVKFEKLAEIRRSFVDETIEIPARTKNGQKLDAMTIKKRYYNAEMDGEAVLLRVREGVPAPLDLKKGDMVLATFEQVGVESDVSQMYVIKLDVVPPKTVK